MEGCEKNGHLFCSHSMIDVMLGPLSKFIFLKPIRGWYYCFYFNCENRGSETLRQFVQKHTAIQECVGESGALAMDEW